MSRLRKLRGRLDVPPAVRPGPHRVQPGFLISTRSGGVNGTLTPLYTFAIPPMEHALVVIGSADDPPFMTNVCFSFGSLKGGQMPPIVTEYFCGK